MSVSSSGVLFWFFSICLCVCVYFEREEEVGLDWFAGLC